MDSLILSVGLLGLAVAIVLFLITLAGIARLTWLIYKYKLNGMTEAIGNLFLSLTIQQAWVLIIVIESLSREIDTHFLLVKISLLCFVEMSLIRALVGIEKMIDQESDPDEAEEAPSKV